MWRLVDFIVCWMFLSPEARWLVYGELSNRNRPRVWRYGRGEVLVIGG
ncbi:MAG: hypothetical protein PVG71_11855 [Anaerolineae bacterium]